MARTLAKALGPKLKGSRIADDNLQMIMPQKDAPTRQKIIQGMWQNLAQTIAEYPHVGRKDFWQKNRTIRIQNKACLETLVGKPFIMVLPHMANWELATLPAVQKGLVIAQLYRPLNNPYLRYLITAQHKNITPHLVAKGAGAARDMLTYLRRGHGVSMLVDQKFWEGEPLDFMGQRAWTTLAPAKLALRLKCPLMPVQVIRHGEKEAEVIYHDPIDPPEDQDQHTQALLMMRQVNDLFASWISRYPDQWIWLHNRWERPRPYTKSHK